MYIPGICQRTRHPHSGRSCTYRVFASEPGTHTQEGHVHAEGARQVGRGGDEEASTEQLQADHDPSHVPPELGAHTPGGQD